MQLSGTTPMAVARLFNTTGGATLLAESQAVASATAIDASVLAQSVYNLNSGASYVFDVQAKLVTGTSVVIDGSDANFYIFAERVA
jgi:hypothetical protein